MTLTYKTGTASRQQILSHLRACDATYVPPLSSRVDLRAYSDKLYTRATCFEAWDEGILAGMLNAYVDGASQEFGFISNVSVLPEFAGKGIARTLLRMCLDYAAEQGLPCIRLEVSPNNQAAMRLYSWAGFKPAGNVGDNTLLQALISAPARPRK